MSNVYWPQPTCSYYNNPAPPQHPQPDACNMSNDAALKEDVAAKLADPKWRMAFNVPENATHEDITCARQKLASLGVPDNRIDWVVLSRDASAGSSGHVVAIIRNGTVESPWNAPSPAVSNIASWVAPPRD